MKWLFKLVVLSDQSSKYAKSKYGKSKYLI